MKQSSVNDHHDTKSATQESNPVVATDLKSRMNSIRLHKRGVVAIVALIVIIVSAGIYIVSNLSMSTSKTTDSLSSSTLFDSPQKLVKQAISHKNGKEVDVITSNSFGGFTSDGYGVYSLPSYRVKEAKFANLPYAGYGIGLLGNSIAASAEYKHLTEFFTQHKFSKISSLESNPYTYNLPFGGQLAPESYAVYESGNMVCSIFHVDTSSVGALKNHLTSIGCADKNSYKKAATDIKVFYNEYVKGDSQPAEGLVFGPPRIQDGVDGYKNASLYIEDAAQSSTDSEVIFFTGLYYQKPTEKGWIYFNGTRGGPIDCAEIDNDVLEKDVVKKAFSSQPCYDAITDKMRQVSAA